MSSTDVTPNQPTLPAEVRFTDAELIFLDESPPGLFPENQNSNFGFVIRKVFSDKTQNISDWQDTIYNERFVNTSTTFLDQWELELGLPANPTGVSISLRRASVLARIQRGPFTRARRNALIESFITTTFGTATQFTPAGVPFDASGVTLYGESGALGSLYNVVESPSTFSYVVNVAASNVPDIAALTRELKRITPAGISFTIATF